MPVSAAGGGDARRHFADVAIGRTVDIMMQIVELADRGKARLQHFHIGEGGDRLDLVGGEAIEKPVHHLAPGPEAVGCRPAALGEPGHPALEGVAVQIGQAGDGDAPHQLSAVRAWHHREQRGWCRR